MYAGESGSALNERQRAKTLRRWPRRRKWKRSNRRHRNKRMRVSSVCKISQTNDASLQLRTHLPAASSRRWKSDVPPLWRWEAKWNPTHAKQIHASGKNAHSSRVSINALLQTRSSSSPSETACENAPRQILGDSRDATAARPLVIIQRLNRTLHTFLTYDLAVQVKISLNLVATLTDLTRYF